ncbi:MAG: pilus assembly FimT family protein [Minisyncoccia bacterium]
MHGFTTFELMISIFLIIILGSISFAAILKVFSTLKLESSVRDLLTDLRYAQELALSEQANFSVVFSTSTSSYTILKEETPIKEIITKKLPTEINFTEINFPEQKVIFNIYGAVKDSGDIILEGKTGKQMKILVTPSGFSKILK